MTESNNDNAVPRRPHPTKIATTGGLNWTAGGYESPTGGNDNNGPSTPVAKSTSTPALPLRRYGSPEDLERRRQHRQSSLHDMLLTAKAARGQIGWRDRIACFQWNWFTMSMHVRATGGIANVLSTIRYDDRWLDIIGLIFFSLNVVLFVTSCVLISLRFHWRPGCFTHTFTDQVESLFIPAIVVSLATILITICEYGIPNTDPWLLHVMEALFWAYVAVATLASAGIYLILWSSLTFPIHTMTPTWVFPAYPLLLTAPFAASLVGAAVDTDRLEHLSGSAITFAAVTVQGAGFLIAFMICSAFIYRLMTQKLPRDAQRPGVFISIGPFGFTVAGIVSLGNNAEKILPEKFLGNPHAIFILKVLSIMVGLWLWGLCVWFFLVSVGSLWEYVFPGHRLPFHITWFSFVFPNTALVNATLQLANALDSHPLELVGCVLAAALVLVWLIIFGTMLKCLWKRELLWPKEED